MNKRDLYDLLCQNNWQSILSLDWKGKDIFSACERAVSRENDLAGAMRLLFVMSSQTCSSYGNSSYLNRAWVYVFKEALTTAREDSDIDAVMDMLAHAEKDKRFDGAKTLLNLLIGTLLTVLPNNAGDERLAQPGTADPARQIVDWCRREGHLSFGFDIALSTGNLEEAYSILMASGVTTSVSEEEEEKEEEEHGRRMRRMRRMMLLDVASHCRNVKSAVTFVDFCFQKGCVQFAFRLATALRLWPVMEKKLKTGAADIMSPTLLRAALRESVLARNWDTVRLLLSYQGQQGQLSWQDVRDELLTLPAARYNVDTLMDLLVEEQHQRRFLQVAVLLVCSSGRPQKAAQILQETGFIMDQALCVSAAKTCFDNHCSPEDLLVEEGPEGERCWWWNRDLLQHILEAPRRKPFSNSQWKCVLTFVDSGRLCPETVLELAGRAVEEDVDCLHRFVDRGADESLMEALLMRHPERQLSGNQLNCLVKLLYKDAGIDLTDIDNVLTEEALALAVTRKQDIIVAAKEVNRSILSAPESCQDRSENGQEPDEQREEKSSAQLAASQPGKEEEDWSTAVIRLSGGDDDDDAPGICPWWFVMKAAQAARRGRHIRRLTERVARQGLWNCLICLSLSSLRQHPLDLLLSQLHPHPERLVQGYIRLKEQQQPPPPVFQADDDGGFWSTHRKKGLKGECCPPPPHDIDILNLQSRGLMEERHRMALLGRALAIRDWPTLMRLSALDLPLRARRVIFRKAMDERQWLLAGEFFLQLPGKADPSVFQAALNEDMPGRTPQELYTWMVECGVCNAYLAPELYADLLRLLDERGADWKQKPQAKPRSSFWKRFRPQRKCKPPIGFQRPNPAVREEDRDRVTSTFGTVVRKAATRGDWQLVMKVYEGGLGEAVKVAVLQAALRQGRLREVTSLVRRDPEADLFYPRFTRQIMTVALDHGAWPCLEAVAERLATQEDREWLFPFALGLARWTLVLTLVRRGVGARLREEALRAALQQNEWTFVMDCTLHLVHASPEDLHPGLKKAVAKSMTQMIAAMRPPSSSGATTFGLHLFKADREGQGQSQGQNRGQGKAEDVNGRLLCEGEGEEETVTDEWTTVDGSTAFQVAARLRLWTVCQVLLHCGANPHPTPTPSHPHDVILLALRDGRPDVIHRLLDHPSRDDVTTAVTDLAVRELLMTHTLSIDADVGIALLRKLLEKRLRCPPAPTETTTTTTMTTATTTTTPTTPTTATTTTTTTTAVTAVPQSSASSADVIQSSGDVTQSSSTDEVAPPSSDVAAPSRNEVAESSGADVTQSSCTDVTQPSSTDVTQPSNTDVTQPSCTDGGVTGSSSSDVSGEARALLERVCRTVEETQPCQAAPGTFQPRVSDAVYSQHIPLPSFLSFFSLVDRGVRPREMKQVDDGLDLEASDSDDGGGGGAAADDKHNIEGEDDLTVPPRVPLRVGKEPRPSPMIRLLPPEHRFPECRPRLSPSPDNVQ